MTARQLLNSAALAVVLGAGLWGTAANSAIIVTDENTGTGNNIIFNGCTAPADATPGDNVVQGCLNTNKNAIIIFTADEPIEIAGGGQAAIEALDGAFTSLTIDFIVPPATSLIALNIDIIDRIAGAEVTFTTPIGSSGPFALDDKGENKFTITGDGTITTLSFTTTGALGGVVVDVKQVRIDPDDTGPNPIPVPEPASLAALGVGLLGLAGISRLRRRRRSV